jgi:threonine/homoserine/homoserine lactone efflux protein
MDPMPSSSLLGFAGVALVVVLAPGPDTFLLLRYALNRPRNGVAAALGMMVSIMGWAALAGLGVAALLETYPAIHQVIAIVGGAYLLYLGLGSLIKARFLAGASAATARTTTRKVAAAETEFTLMQSVRAGALSAALNPKLGLLFLALMPPFIPAGSNTLGSALVLGAIFAIMGFAYLMVLTAIAARAMAWFKSPTVGIWLERVSSGALAIMGIVVLLGAFT